MTARETWVLYDEDGNPISTAKTERTTWTRAWFGVNGGLGVGEDGFYAWRDLCISRGWKCLRVVPAEGQT